MPTVQFIERGEEMSQQTKIYFQLVQDEDGYPPVAVESVWAWPGEKIGEYIIDNVPFFTCDATLGDVVVTRDEEGHRWFETVAHRSRNSLVRVVFFDPTCVERISKYLQNLGCSTEYEKTHNLLAVSIPEEVELTEVQAYLENETSAGKIDYEEAILRQK
jgi:hypothetical protein